MTTGTAYTYVRMQASIQSPRLNFFFVKNKITNKISLFFFVCMTDLKFNKMFSFTGRYWVGDNFLIKHFLTHFSVQFII